MKKQLKGGGVIGITGFARTGKDTLCGALLERANEASRRVALADELKREMAPIIKNYFNIDAFTDDDKEKSLIRPLMVAWGGIRREETQGTHWTALVTEKVKDIVACGGWAIITDIRYANPKFKNDEVNWLKDNGGKLIHLKKYKLKSVSIDLDGRIKLRRVFTKAPNEQEKTNDKILIGKADFKIEWGEVGNSLSKLDKYVDDLVDYLNETQGIK
jgi:hypothetical protein